MFSAAAANALDSALDMPRILENEVPTAAKMRLLESQFYANAATMHSDRGGGHMGHIGAVMPQLQYLNFQGTIIWHDPVSPPPLPPLNGETAPQITKRNRQHLADQTEHRFFVENLKALRKLLLDNVHPIHYMHLRDPLLGFGNVHPRDILQHLMATYATDTSDELTANQERLGDPWDPSQPIATLWNRQTEIHAFAAPHDPISWNTIVRITASLFENSGVFPAPVRDWRRRPPAQQTWANLQLDFNHADRELRRQATTGSHFANLAETAIRQQTQRRMEAYAHFHQEAPSAIGLYPERPTHQANAAAAAVALRALTVPYCFTHGVTWDTQHISHSCRNKCRGHQDTATVDNMMGGNNTIRRLPGERPHSPAQQRNRPRNRPQPGAMGRGGRGPPNPDLERMEGDLA